MKETERKNPEEEIPCEDDCCGASGSSRVGYCKGNLRLQHELPPYYAFGFNEAPNLVYDSKTADARPVVAKLLMLGLIASAGSPTAVQTSVSIEGVQTDIYLKPANQDLPLNMQWQPINGRGQRLANGAYPFTLDVSGLYTVAPGIVELFRPMEDCRRSRAVSF